MVESNLEVSIYLINKRDLNGRLYL